MPTASGPHRLQQGRGHVARPRTGCRRWRPARPGGSRRRPENTCLSSGMPNGLVELGHVHHRRGAQRHQARGRQRDGGARAPAGSRRPSPVAASAARPTAPARPPRPAGTRVLMASATSRPASATRRSRRPPRAYHHGRQRPHRQRRAPQLGLVVDHRPAGQEQRDRARPSATCIRKPRRPRAPHRRVRAAMSPHLPVQPRRRRPAARRSRAPSTSASAGRPARG